MLRQFFDGPSEEIVSTERRRRIRLALWAYAYEFENVSLVDDYTFDAESLKVDPSIRTGHEVLDTFFEKNFDPSTGQWIHSHPELDKVRGLYHWLYSRNKKEVDQ